MCQYFSEIIFLTLVKKAFPSKLINSTLDRKWIHQVKPSLFVSILFKSFSEIKSRPSFNSLNTNTLIFADEDSWFSEDSDQDEDDIFDEDEEDDSDYDRGVEVLFEHEDEEVFEAEIDGEVDAAPENISEESEDDFDEEVNSATFIMNQKSLVDKAPGALQHSFAHRTIDLPNSFHVRLFQFMSVFVICSMTAGIPFGLPAMRQLLVEAGIYGEGCSAGHEHRIHSASHMMDAMAHTSKRVGCSIQEARLAILQVSGWVSWMVGGWIAARSVQKLGPRNTGMLGCALILVGALLLAVSVPVNGEFWLPEWMRMYVFPVMVMSVGSSFSFLACLHYVRLFPKRTSLLHSIMFLAQDLSAFIYYIMYESREIIPLRISLIFYSGLMLGQLIFWRFVFSSGKVPTIRFTVTTWHQRALLVDKPLSEHISSPYFSLALLFTVTVFLKIYFYMSTFQVQLRILLIPTRKEIDPEDFTYKHNDHFDENGNNRAESETSPNPLLNERGELDFKNFKLNSPQSIPSSRFQASNPSAPQSFSHVPFFAEQPGGTSSNNINLRQFIYNPMQPEIFLTDLQEMMYFLIPVASLITIFWMRSSMSDRKISTALLFSVIPLVFWGFVQ